MNHLETSNLTYPNTFVKFFIYLLKFQELSTLGVLFSIKPRNYNKNSLDLQTLGDPITIVMTIWTPPSFVITFEKLWCRFRLFSIKYEYNYKNNTSLQKWMHKYGRTVSITTNQSQSLFKIITLTGQNVST